MIITCDKCDTQFELDENPEQLVDSDVRCVHCNAILDVDMQAIRKRVAKSSKSRSDASAPKTPEKEKNFLRTDMPGKKRKKKSKSKSLKSDLPKSADVKGRKGDAADTGQDMPDAVAADAMGGGFLEKSDDLDFLMDREEDSGAGDIVNEKTEVLNIDDYNDIEFRAGSNGKPDSGKISGGPDGADFSIDRDLFLDFDLDGMGIDTDSPKGIDSPGAPSDADEFDEFDEMEPFALDLDDEFSVDSDGETIVLDMDMDDESEKFHNPLSRDIDKDTADVNSKAASPKMNLHGLPDDSDELEPFSMDLDGPLGSSDKDGLLDLFLGLDMDQMKTSGESSGGLVTEGGGLKLGIEDSDLDADMASSSDEARLGLDENLLLDMDLDFDEDEHGLATVVGDGNDDASKADHALGESPDDVGLGLDENLLLDLDLDLDFDEDEQGLATVVADSEDGKPTPDPVSRPAADDAELGLDEDLLLDLDLDLDFDEDEQGLATVAVDGQGENLLQESAPGEAMNDADPALDENLLTDLDLDLNVEKGEETPAALELTDAEDDSIELTFDLDDDDMGAADETPAVSEEEFSLELDIDDAEDALSLSDDDGDAPVLDLETALEGVGDSGESASVSEEEFSLELNLDDAEEVDSRSDEGADVPILDLEIAPEDGPGESALDSEGGFTLELDLDDISEEPDLLGEDADVSNAASETEDTGVLAAVNGDSDSEDEFLFNMDLEKFEDAPDELESTAPVAGHFDRTGELDSELTSDSPELMSKSADMPESFEVVEEILLSSDHDKNAQDNVQQDEEFIDAFDMGIPTDEFEELNENRRDEEKPEKITIGDEGASTDIAPVGRRRLGLPVLILLLALLGALLFWAYSFGLFEGFNAKNIIHKIPIVKEYFPVPPKHAGEIVTLENTIKNRFVENKVVGTLFVITGKVRNDFPTHRSHIQVVGKLFSPGKKPAGVESVYCGNSLTDEELVSLPPDQIKARLGDKSGKNTSNVNVPPGKILPYMIVFHNLPETLEEYTVAVKGSQPSSG